MNKIARHQRVCIHPYVDRELAKRLAEYSAASAIASSTVVQAALRQYLDRTSDTTLIPRRLDRLGRADARAHRDLSSRSPSHCVPRCIYGQSWRVETSTTRVRQALTIPLPTVQPHRRLAPGHLRRQRRRFLPSTKRLRCCAPRERPCTRWRNARNHSWRCSRRRDVQAWALFRSGHVLDSGQSGQRF